jgi:periplasmic divalent cation tolerance protein
MENTMPTTITLIYCPFPSAESARDVATTLLNEHLVACCNLSPVGESLYRWEGILTSTPEIYLLCKTTPAQAGAATVRIATLHPYECPAILTVEAAANTPFATWLTAQTTPHENK